MNCLVCNERLDPVLEPDQTHPNCFSEPHEGDPLAALLKHQLIQVIKWQENRNPRAHQLELGPSELGEVCDRRLAYRILGMEHCNTDFDPWASIMGTAVHSWLESALTDWMTVHGDQSWSTETTLQINNLVHAHSDLYSHKFKMVIDWKTAGPDAMKKMVKEGPPQRYITQVQVYGYGFEKAGWDVGKVGLFFLPRAGWLKNAFVWTGDYDRNIAIGALRRVYEIAQQVTIMNISKDSNTHRFEQIEATPSNDCGWCPWYDPGRDPERGADGTGCPGR